MESHERSIPALVTAQKMTVLFFDITGSMLPGPSCQGDKRIQESEGPPWLPKQPSSQRLCLPELWLQFIARACSKNEYGEEKTTEARAEGNPLMKPLVAHAQAAPNR